MMRTTLRIVLILLLGSLLAGCLRSENKKTNLPASQGKKYEVLVVCSQEKWEGAVGDTLRSILLEPVPILNQKEPRLDVMRIQPKDFSGLLALHRNVLIVNTGEQYAELSLLAQENVNSEPQIVVRVAGPSDSVLVEYMSAHRAELLSFFEITERDREVDFNKTYRQKAIGEVVFRKFGFNMDIPQGYKIRNDKPKDFMWISNEFPQASQGVVIYSYPYSGKEIFSADSLTAWRNRFTALIPGPSDGSCMTTAEAFLPEVTPLRINGRFWAEMRGFWDVKGDFMGGPFVSYSTLDTETRRVVTLDFYVYSPKEHKRNYLRALEALIYSVSFPADEAAREAAEAESEVK